jgi:hypothetical protein
LLEALEPLCQSLGAVKASAPEFEKQAQALLRAIDTLACEMAAAANTTSAEDPDWVMAA